MALFLSTYINKIDRKGRVSVPAAFRAALADQPFQGVVLFRSGQHQCLEGFGWAAMEEMSSRLDHFDLFSSEQDDLATAIFGEAVQLPFDGDGRIILPKDLGEFAALFSENENAHEGVQSGQAAFVGLGRKFQIWSPEKFEARKNEARAAVKDAGLTLPKGEK